MKLAIITGGSRGLGEALCKEYFSRGWNVVEFSRGGTKEYSVRLDLADLPSAARMIERTLRSIDQESVEEIVAINNAGTINPIAQIPSLSVGEIEESLTINLASGIVFAHLLAEIFQDLPCKKTFVGISSGAALKGYSGWSLYCAGKAGMENFIRSFALEQQDKTYPLCAININPSIMDTDMQVQIRESDESDFPTVERFRAFKAGGQLRQPAYVARRIAEIVESDPEPGSTQSIS